MRIIKFILGGIVAGFLGLAFIVSLLIYTDSELIEDAAEALISTVLARETTIGNLAIHPGWVTHVQIQNVTIKNPEWAKSTDMLSIADGEATFAVWPALKGNLNFESIVLRQLSLALEKNADGQRTWDFNEAAEMVGSVAVPEERQEFPGVDIFRVSDASIHLIDVPRNLDKKLIIGSSEGALRQNEDAKLSLTGGLEGAPLKLTFTGGSLRELRSAKAPYPVDLSASFQRTSVTVKGTIDQPLGNQYFDIVLELKGPTLAELFPLIAVPLPDTPPYMIAGNLKRGKGVWQVHDLAGTVGDSDLRGEITLEQSQAVPMLTADLESKVLDLDDLAGLIGATPDLDETANKSQERKGTKSQANERVFPDTKLNTGRLDAMNMDVSLDAARVMARDIPVNAIKYRLHLVDRQITVDPLMVKMAGGVLEGRIFLDARQATPSTQSSFSFRDLDLKPFFAATAFVQEMGGTFYGSISLDGVGDSFAEMMSAASGEAWLGIRNGTLSGLIVEAIGLDVLESLALVVGDDATISMPCGRIEATSKAGLVDITRAVLDTSDSVLYAVGNANLNQEMFNLQIEAVSKDFSLLDFSAPISVTGSFNDPSVAIGGVEGLSLPDGDDTSKIDCNRLISGGSK